MEEDDFLPDPMALKGYIIFTLKPFGSIAFPDLTSHGIALSLWKPRENGIGKGRKLQSWEEIRSTLLVKIITCCTLDQLPTLAEVASQQFKLDFLEVKQELETRAPLMDPTPRLPSLSFSFCLSVLQWVLDKKQKKIF